MASLAAFACVKSKCLQVLAPICIDPSVAKRKSSSRVQRLNLGICKDLLNIYATLHVMNHCVHWGRSGKLLGGFLHKSAIAGRTAITTKVARAIRLIITPYTGNIMPVFSERHKP